MNSLRRRAVVLLDKERSLDLIAGEVLRYRFGRWKSFKVISKFSTRCRWIHKCRDNEERDIVLSRPIDLSDLFYPKISMGIVSNLCSFSFRLKLCYFVEISRCSLGL